MPSPELAREAGTEQVSCGGEGGDLARVGAGHGGRPGRRPRGGDQAETQGNPLFAKEIGQLLAAEGATARAGLPIPRGVLEAIGQRLRRRSKRCREVLDTGLGRRPGVRPGRARAHERPRRGTRSSPRWSRTPPPGWSETCPMGWGVWGSRASSGVTRSTRTCPARAACACTGRSRRRSRSCTPATPGPPHVAELAQHYGAAGPAAAEKAIVYTPSARQPPRASTHTRRRRAGTHGRSRGFETARSRRFDDRMRELLLARGEALSAGASRAAARPARSCAGRPSWPSRAVVPTSSRAPLGSTRTVAGGRGGASTPSTCRCSSGRLPRWARMTASRACACWRGSRRRGATKPRTRSVSRWASAKPWRWRNGWATRRRWRWRSRATLTGTDGPDTVSEGLSIAGPHDRARRADRRQGAALRRALQPAQRTVDARRTCRRRRGGDGRARRPGEEELRNSRRSALRAPSGHADDVRPYGRPA